MGILICVCVHADLATCSACGFAKKFKPVKMFNGPWQRQYIRDQAMDHKGLDALADQIMRGMTEAELAVIGFNKDMTVKEEG
jgi:hypothetical protein